MNPFLSKSHPQGGKEKVKMLGGRSAPPWLLKGPKSAGLNRVKEVPMWRDMAKRDHQGVIRT